MMNAGQGEGLAGHRTLRCWLAMLGQIRPYTKQALAKMEALHCRRIQMCQGAELTHQ